MINDYIHKKNLLEKLNLIRLTTIFIDVVLINVVIFFFSKYNPVLDVYPTSVDY